MRNTFFCQCPTCTLIDNSCDGYSCKYAAVCWKCSTFHNKLVHSPMFLFDWSNKQKRYPDLHLILPLVSCSHCGKCNLSSQIFETKVPNFVDPRKPPQLCGEIRYRNNVMFTKHSLIFSQGHVLSSLPFLIYLILCWWLQKRPNAKECKRCHHLVPLRNAPQIKICKNLGRPTTWKSFFLLFTFTSPIS